MWCTLTDVAWPHKRLCDDDLLVFPSLAGEAGRDQAFADVVSAGLELVETRILDGRVVLSEYRPTGHDIPRAAVTEPRTRG